MAKTFYDIFEVTTGATPDEIRVAYKRMVQRHHPDKHRGHASSEELLKAINYAYSILSDVRKRASYDAKLASSAYVYTGEATVNGAAGAQTAPSASASKARDPASEAFTARPFETRSTGWSQISHINSWLAFGMLALLFFAASRFFYQVATHGIRGTAEPDNATLFYGMMIGGIIAAGAVWLAGKMVAYTLPLAWPMNLIFRSKVRSDLYPEHRRIASAVLVSGILLTFAVPDLDRHVDLATPPTATAPILEDTLETPVAAQSSRKNATTLFAVESVSPVVLVQNAPLPPVVKKPSVMVAALPPSPVKTVVPPVSRVTVEETKAHNTPVPVPTVVAEARIKPVGQEKPVIKKTPLVAALPAKTPVAILPPSIEKKTAVGVPLPESKAPPVIATAPAPVPALALVTPESSAVTAKVSPAESMAAKKETPTLQNDAGEGDPTLSKHRNRAQQGAADAQYQLGRAYEKGEARDYRQAEAWYRKAADQGYGPAQHSLGSMAMLGKGMAMDPVSAYVWLSLAANNNVTSGQQMIDYLVDTLTPVQLADAKRKVAKWSPQRKR